MTAADSAVQLAAATTRPARVWRLPSEPSAIARVREVAAAAARGMALSPDTVDSVVLAIDELATNAMRTGPFEVRLYEEPRVSWGVADARPESLTEVALHLGRTPADALETGLPLCDAGRGLQIVGALFPEHEVRMTTLASGVPGKEIRVFL